MSFLPLGTPRPTPYAYDGASAPTAGNNGFRDPNTALTWLAWERGITQVNPTRIVSWRTYSDAGSWSAEYAAGQRTLGAGDVHGVPAISGVLNSGFVFGFYGSHNSALNYFVNVNANDPSLTRDSDTIAGVHTFPTLVSDTTNIYLFDSTTGTDGGLQNTIELSVCSPSGSTLNAGAFSKLVYAYINSGSPGWLYPGSAVNSPDGTEVWFTCSYAPTFAGVVSTTYLFRCVKATGAIKNYSGSTTVAAGSLPITSSNIASFLLESGTDLGDGGATLVFDSNGNPHVAWAVGSNGSNAVIYHGVGNGTTFGSELVYTYANTDVSPQAVEIAMVATSGGGIDFYFGDGAAQYSLGAFSQSGDGASGNILTCSRDSGGTYTPVRRFLSMAVQGLDDVVAVANGSSNLQITFSEVSFDYTTLSGALRCYAFGKGSGFVGASQPSRSSQATSFLARLPGNLSLNQINAYAELIDGLVLDGVFALLDALYVFTSETQTAANLNLISSSYPITATGSPTFTASHGYSGCTNTTKYLDPAFNPSTVVGAQFAQNSASFGILTLDIPSGSGVTAIGQVSAGAGQSYLIPGFSGAIYGGANLAVDTDTGSSIAAHSGLYAITRTGSGSCLKVYDNSETQISFSLTETSAAPQNNKILIGSSGGAAYGSWPQNLAAAFIGGGLTINQIHSLAVRMSIYLDQVAL